MNKVNTLWRAFYSIGIVGIAVLQLVKGNFMPVIIPSSIPYLPGCLLCIWVVSLLFIVKAILIAGFEKYARSSALFVGVFLLILFLALHLPYQVETNMHFLAGWSDALKILALSGGAFVVAGSLTNPVAAHKPGSWVAKLIPLGRYFFAIDILVAGIMHFLYMPFVAMLVPAWLPWHTFWGYLAGVALIASALGIILNIQLKLAANLLGAIIFIWFITLHIPRAIADPVSGNGNEIVSVFEALAFSGIAFLIAANAKVKRA
ncbi:hypothetical protein [Mucilaginibacter sp. dw_454]|uniref:hypothetical protein n=1 Tax=Mucilaginibacter sp. dw_454 TaxID=2720079 RepID=UPI001BD2A18A|nr:hypothetical protein [Mucilaginibacter sp. dw_454]